mmetsp:Transcript_25833/g.43248  ORF Transcript_25833/g.43248 Transcript_25833/m.43248 type:complete len:430 (-) Transcript_25833:247-1536(-)
MDEIKDPKKMQIARDLLQAVGDKASSIITSTKSSSRLAKFSIETIETLGNPFKTFTVSKWETYGEPLLTTFDNTLDRAIAAVKTPFSTSADISPDEMKTVQPPESHQASYFLYWEKVKELFLKSRWFAQVDKILRENGAVKILNQSILRPAEMFFNTATEVFCVEASLEGFLDTLRTRVGPVWDTRLGELSASFFRVATRICESVGAQKCLQGFMNLKNARKDMAVDDLTNHLSKADLNKEEERKTLDKASMEPAVQTPAPLLKKPTTTSWVRIGTVRRLTSTNTKPGACTAGQARKRYRKGGESYFRKRHGTPYARESMPKTLKRKLKAKSWFRAVDDILRQNEFIKALPKKIVPSQHFFETAVRALEVPENTEDAEMFSNNLQSALGFSWDSRLVPLSNEFHQTAKQLLRRQRLEASHCRKTLHHRY